MRKEGLSRLVQSVMVCLLLVWMTSQTGIIGSQTTELTEDFVPLGFERIFSLINNSEDYDVEEIAFLTEENGIEFPEVEEDTEQGEAPAEKTYSVIVNEGEIIKLNKAEILEAVNGEEYGGEGSVSWEGWKDIKKTGYQTAEIPVSLINDDVYTSMKLPSDSTNYYMSYRKNGIIYDYMPTGYTKSCGIGAIYPVYGLEMPDTISICVGKFRVYFLKDEDGAEWEEFTESPYITDVKSMQVRPLPWTVSVDLASTRPYDKVTFYKDYFEILIPGKEFGPTEQYPSGEVYHFYTKKQAIESEKIKAAVVIYEIWSNTPDIEGKVLATTGLDYWASSSHQMMSGRSYFVKNEVSTVICHDIPDQLYAELVTEGKSPEKCLEMFYQD